MPTPNWGPQAGVPMDEAAFDAYVASNPPGVERPGQPNVFWGGAPVFGAEQVDPGSREGGSVPVSLGATPQPYQLPMADVLGAQIQAGVGQFYGGGLSGLGAQASSQQAQARAEQQRVIQALQEQAAGSLTTQAQQALRQNYGLAQSQQSSLGSTMRGTSAGAAQRGIQAGQSGIQRGFAGDQQMLKLQEQQAAQALLAQMLQQQRGQDVDYAAAQAQAQLNERSQRDQMLQMYEQLYGSMNKGNQGSGLDFIRAGMGLDLAQRDLNSRYAQMLTQGAATAAGALSKMDWSGGQGYRQVDGQNSIVPLDDK